MSFDFIQVNQSILDYSEYVRNVLLLKNYLKHRFFECLFEEGFRLESDLSESYCGARLVLYRQSIDLEVEIIVRKRAPEQFL